MSARPLTDLLRLCAGPGVWFAHFIALYGGEALLCTPPAGSGRAMTWLGVVATVAALAALLAFAVMVSRDASGDRTHEHSGAAFLRGATLLLALLSAVGVAWTALPIVALSACAPPAG